MTLKKDAKFEEKLTCCLENDIRNFANSHQSTRKSQNWNFDKILWSKVGNVWASNLQWSCVMTMKNDTKIDEELTCCFKIDMNFTKFDLSTRKSLKNFFVLIGSLWPKYILFEMYRDVQKSTEELSFVTLKGDAKFEEKLSCG